MADKLRNRKLPVKHYEIHKLVDWIDSCKIDLELLSGNLNGVNLLEQNKYKIDWIRLSANENAIYLLEKNPDKIWWPGLSIN